MSNISLIRRSLLWILSAVYLVAGCFHLFWPQPFLGITPSFVPFPRQVILVTGLCEIAGAIALCFPRYRKAACLALALYAVCVYPANIKHAMDSLSGAHAGWVSWAYHLSRLAFQPVFVWWPLFGGNLICWPFQSRGTGKA